MLFGYVVGDVRDEDRAGGSELGSGGGHDGQGRAQRARWSGEGEGEEEVGREKGQRRDGNGVAAFRLESQGVEKRNGKERPRS